MRDTDEFVKATNEQYAAWCAAYYVPDSLDDRGMKTLDGLWAWQEQERRMRAAVAAERKRWRSAAEYAAHQLEKARIWGGMEWHYNPLHPLHYRSALERLRDVLRALE